MISRKIWAFNIASLLLTLGASAVLFPYASLPEETLRAAEQPLPMEAFPDADLGPDYGQVPVIELMGYYLENPPVKESGSAPKQQHFGGC
ncbi:hypothetical protein [Sedimenticola hydrogenitrophicus]|uniref:hypothetical protein n=1 Tax=Sedimenticola hydrogenitrophicus TaxID=2967975 RepID=UPI0023AF29E4|nr:hypothetical protein [Sedimenticola hydrogenitrophicus]